MLDTNGAEHLYLTFSTSHKGRELELLRGGASKDVDDRNKRLYARLSAEHAVRGRYQPHADAFRYGLNVIFPLERCVPSPCAPPRPSHSRPSSSAAGKELQQSGANQLAAVIGGSSEIDAGALLSYLQCQKGTNAEKEAHGWFENCVRDMSQGQLSALLEFCTGTPRAPVEGFAKGPLKLEWKSHITTGLPTTYTCFRMIQMPLYASEAELHRGVNAALTFGSKGFTFG